MAITYENFKKADSFSAWTIYFNPSDCPGLYVVRKHCVTPEGTTSPSKFAEAFNTLEEARKSVPKGTIRLNRQPGDDPVIVETWI